MCALFIFFSLMVGENCSTQREPTQTCRSTNTMQFRQKNTFISCRAPGEFCYVVDIVIFCHLMWLGSGNISTEIVLSELLRWNSIVHVKYGYRGDDWNLSPKRKLKPFRYSFIPIEPHIRCVEWWSINWPQGQPTLHCLISRAFHTIYDGIAFFLQLTLCHHLLYCLHPATLEVLWIFCRVLK